MRQALQPLNRAYKRSSFSLPAPVGGWNTRDAISSMGMEFASVLDNFIPRQRYLELRGGVKKVVDLANLETLVSYEYNGIKKMIAGGGGSLHLCDVFDGTSSVLKSGFANNRWQDFFFKGNRYLMNGADNMQVYNGTTLEDAAFTGTDFDGTKIIAGTLYRNRPILIEKDSLAFWYTTAAGAVSGPVERFDLAQLSRAGGEIMLAENWTQDGGDGQDDQIVFITSQGEAFVYSGSNPADADNWALKGIYRVPRPISRRGVEKLGGDIVYLSEEGYFLLSNLLAPVISNKAIAFSNTIEGAVKDARSSFGNFGWQIKAFPSESLLIVNVPKTGTVSEQHVMDTSTGSWCRFRDIPAVQWTPLNGTPYFCNASGIYKAQEGYDDEGEYIKAGFQYAYTDLGVPLLKQIKEVQVFLSAFDTLQFSLTGSVDFKDAKTIFKASPAANESSWDTSEWDITPWASESAAFSKRICPTLPTGQFFSFGITTQSKQQPIKFLNLNLFYVVGKN